MAQNLWKKYKSNLAHYQDIGLMIDISRMNFGSTYFSEMSPIISGAFEEMAALEKGKIANPDENRMVGHYWLRAPELAPTPEITQSITDALDKIITFTSNIHTGAIIGEKGGKFKNILIIGIGGSALGPQFLMDALGSASDPMHSYFFDNTDPDGMDRVLAFLKDSLAETLTIVISKSGGTKETRNGMIEAREAYRRAGLIFEKHAVAVTGEGSELYHIAEANGWIDIFPMWDWVGGRTSVLSPVGLLPAALQGINILDLLEGAKLCDSLTRDEDPRKNPAATLALMWHYATQGKGSKDMVILPYKDRLQFFSRYLQQLIMESIGKETDLAGRQVNQGLTVYGNKGSTDQHAYVQQLRDGVNNFFVTFIEVLRDREGKSQHVEPDVTSGDYLIGFLLGTREALYEKGRESITITLENMSASTVGSLIALYERAVGLYALMININAYHQPGVEAGKKAAQSILSLQAEILNQLRKERKKIHTVDEIAAALNKEDRKELIFKILEHMRANSDHGVIMLEGDTVLSRGYQIIR